MDLFQQIFVVCIVMATFGAALWTLRRRGLVTFRGPSGTRARQLQILERVQLTPQHALCLVRFDNATLLIGTAPSSCSVLSTNPSTNPVALPAFEANR